ncbi:hypothetical protein [Argonema antarcticum]|uniref:hypothetical protein n=1 Tax=Argonema antarcticum TaxID=2942763 RepID=UPI002012B430|nr:hypothetical protein [Argonema antarcticum]MCL1473809.1 hypothetical protein [Argonema antarcticum A004/B2]
MALPYFTIPFMRSLLTMKEGKKRSHPHPHQHLAPKKGDRTHIHSQKYDRTLQSHKHDRTHIHSQKYDRTLQFHQHDCLRHALAFAPTSIPKQERTLQFQKHDCLRHE